MVSATLIATLKRRRERLVIAKKWYDHLYGNVNGKESSGCTPLIKNEYHHPLHRKEMALHGLDKAIFLFLCYLT